MPTIIAVWGCGPLCEGLRAAWEPAFTAYHSLGHTRPSWLPDPGTCLHVRFLPPGECGSFHQPPCLTLSGFFTTLLVLLSLERQEEPAGGVKSVAGGVNLGARVER